jgi:DNA repair protein RadD
VLFLAHRREIIDQTSRKLPANGIRLGMHGIVVAGRERDLRPQAMVQVASIDTLLARGIRSETMPLPPADLIIFDEAHRTRGRTREHLIKRYPDAALIGLTATPCRGAGSGTFRDHDPGAAGRGVDPARLPRRGKGIRTGR